MKNGPFAGHFAYYLLFVLVARAITKALSKFADRLAIYAGRCCSTDDGIVGESDPANR